jgi:hypothetical protein
VRTDASDDARAADDAEIGGSDASDGPATGAVTSAVPDPDGGDAVPARRVRRWWLVGVGVAAIVAGIVLLVVHLASPQLPGQSISGSVAQNPAQEIQRELAQATALVNQGSTSSISEALTIYQRILDQAPNQPQALAELGWLEWTAGAKADDPTLVAEGKSLVEHSLKIRPDDYAARFYLGTMLLKQGDPTDAIAQYRLFLSQGPPSSEVTTAAPLIREAFTDAKQPLPAGVPTS